MRWSLWCYLLYVRTHVCTYPYMYVCAPACITYVCWHVMYYLYMLTCHVVPMCVDMTQSYIYVAFVDFELVALRNILCTYSCMYVRTYSCMYVCMYVYSSTHTHTHTHTHIHAPRKFLHVQQFRPCRYVKIHRLKCYVFCLSSIWIIWAIPALNPRLRPNVPAQL